MVALAEVITGAASTVSVKFCVASGVMPLVAVMTKAKIPLTVGVPDRTPAVLSVTPVGKEPEVTENVGAGVPVAVTVNVPTVPSVKVVALAEVIAGGLVTVKVKFCVASGVIPLLAVMVTANTPFTEGVPDSTPVLLLKVTPVGKEPVVIEKMGAGVPVAVTVNVPALP